MTVIEKFKIFLFIIEFFSMIGIYTISFSLSNYKFSIYGLFISLYFINQMYSSRKNNLKNIEFDNNIYQLSLNHSYYQNRSALLVVGHQERKDYWKKCLESIIKCIQNENRLEYVLIIIDGNTIDDIYMYTMAREILKSNIVEIISISQRGKRNAMYYGFNKIRQYFTNEIENVDVIVSDSDTVLNEDAISKLRSCLYSDPNNGCATGMLYIYNTNDGLLPKIIDCRYAYAFSIERGCTSYYNCMTCCSGPLSIYKLSCLDEDILKRFITQSIIDYKCEPGDDRHLTNLILAQGFYSKQTNLAIAGTEAPENFTRFIRQQLRWSRSYFRELYWQIKAIPYQSYFLSIVCIYETLFPFFVSFWVFYSLFYRKNMYDIIQAFIISLIVSFIKGISLYYYFKKISMLFMNISYFPLYFSILLPLKIYASMTLLNNKWVTVPHRQRTLIFQNVPWDFIFIGLWNVLLIFGIINLFLNELKY